MTSIGSTVVEHSVSDPKFEGSNLDIGTGREKNTKLYTKMASASRTVVDHTKSDSKFEGSNPAGTCREIMEKIYHNFARICSTVVELVILSLSIGLWQYHSGRTID